MTLRKIPAEIAAPLVNDALKKRYQVFVSSTYSDLIEERKHVIQALLETKCIPSGMELFPAASVDQWTLIKRVIDDCDYYIVIVAGKYGSCGPDGRSYTEMEFDYAVESGKPVLGFYHENLDLLLGAKLEKSEKLRGRLEEFTGKVKSRICRPWHNPESLASGIKSAILNAIEQHPRPGWVRADKAPDSELVAGLKQRIYELEAKANRPPKSSFADGETSIELPVTIRYSNRRDVQHTRRDRHNDKQIVTTTLADIFGLIAPRLMKKGNRSGLKQMVNHWTGNRLQEYISHLTAMGADHPTVDVDLDEFDRVLNTLVARKLLKRVPPPPHVKTKAFYYQLTSSGVQQLAEQKALPHNTKRDTG